MISDGLVACEKEADAAEAEAGSERTCNGFLFVPDELRLGRFCELLALAAGCDREGSRKGPREGLPDASTDFCR